MLTSFLWKLSGHVYYDLDILQIKAFLQVQI